MSGWNKGPLPPNTWHWGGVVPVGEEDKGGFFFADFCGDHVKIMDGSDPPRILKPDEIAWWCNDLRDVPS